MLPFRTPTANPFSISSHRRSLPAHRRSLPVNSYGQRHASDNALLHEMSTDGEWFEAESRGTYAQFSLNRSAITVTPPPQTKKTPHLAPRPNVALRDEFTTATHADVNIFFLTPLVTKGMSTPLIRRAPLSRWSWMQATPWTIVASPRRTIGGR